MTDPRAVEHSPSTRSHLISLRPLASGPQVQGEEHRGDRGSQESASTEAAVCGQKVTLPPLTPVAAAPVHMCILLNTSEVATEVYGKGAGVGGAAAACRQKGEVLWGVCWTAMQSRWLTEIVRVERIWIPVTLNRGCEGGFRRGEGDAPLPASFSADYFQRGKDYAEKLRRGEQKEGRRKLQNMVSLI